MYLQISGLWCQTLEIIFISDHQAHGLLLQMFFSDFLDTFPYTVHIILNIAPQIKNIVLNLNKTKSINVPVYYTGPLKKLFHYAKFQKFFHIFIIHLWSRFYNTYY